MSKLKESLCTETIRMRMVKKVKGYFNEKLLKSFLQIWHVGLALAMNN